MRVIMLVSALMGLGLAAGELPTLSSGVGMTAKLQGTLAGQIVQRRLKVYVGKTVDFYVIHQGTSYRYSGKIAGIIVPDIANLTRTGDHSEVRFKARLRDVQAQENNDLPLPKIVDLRQLNLRGYPASHLRHVGRVQRLDANELLRGNYQEARLLARYKGDNGEIFWEALIEIKRDSQEARREIEEPFVVLLNRGRDFYIPVGYPEATVD